MRSSALWFNTLTAAVAAAGLAFAAVGVLLVMSGALDPERAVPFSWFTGALAQARALGGGEEALAYALCVVVALLGLLTALIELRLLLPAGATELMISDDELGITTIERESVESYLTIAVLGIEGVEAATVRVRPHRDGALRVRAQLSLSPNRDVVVPSTSQTARDTMIETADQQLGLEIADLAVASAMRPSRADRKRQRHPLA